MINVTESWGEGQWHYEPTAPAAVRVFRVFEAASKEDAAKAVPQKGQGHPRDPQFVAGDPVAVPLAVGGVHVVGVLYTPPGAHVVLEVDYHPARPRWFVRTRPDPE